jgi:hypothetical protein
MDRLWICKDQACEGAAIRSYDAIVANGEPSCPQCGGDMKLTKASCRDFDLVSKTIRL